MLFNRLIERSPFVTNPFGHWDDLSWPTQRKTKEYLDSANLGVEFGRDLLRGYFRRLDSLDFIRRKGLLFQVFVPALRVREHLVLRIPKRVRSVVEV